MPTIRLVAGLVLLSSWTQAAETPCASATGRTITLTGSATVRLPPDRVAFTVGVESADADVAKAFAVNETKVKAVVTALKTKGVAPKDIQTSNLDISSRDERGQSIPGFRVSNRVTVTGDDPSKVGELLQAAVAAGANQAGGLSFYVADSSKIESRGLELAFQDARGKAETLAALSKKTLGDVVCVSEVPPWSRGDMNNYVAFTSGGTGMEAGTEDVPFSVSVVFELK